MSRLSNLFYVLLGAVAVGAVVAALAVVGALPSKIERTTANTTTTADAPQSTTTPAALDSAPTSVADIYSKVSGSVVFVSARGGNGALGFNGSGGGKAASGSGFVIDTAGHIVTNDHVVENADKFTVRFGEKGNPITAKLVGKDPSSDLAVLSVDPKAARGVKPLQLASSSNLRPGQATIAIGSPFGLSGTVTTGIISALHREIEAPNGFSIPGAVQTDAAINPGNSGGPLLDAAGRVIGVNSQIASSSGGNTGVGFAVPVDSIRNVIPRLLKDGHIDRAYLGLASGERPATPGALVGTVNPGTPADDAGIKTGDLITALDGKTVRNPSELSLDVLTKKPGDSVKVELKRGGSTKTVTVKLGRRPNRVSQ
ncbi:MAG: trypsin-like peptidase domain-containing protein [Solirubrobacteraceae bacterium]